MCEDFVFSLFSFSFATIRVIIMILLKSLNSYSAYFLWIERSRDAVIQLDSVRELAQSTHIVIRWTNGEQC